MKWTFKKIFDEFRLFVCAVILGVAGFIPPKNHPEGRYIILVLAYLFNNWQKVRKEGEK